MTTLASGAIAAPEPGLTGEEMIARARGMREVLRERQDRCEALGRLPEQTRDEFVDAGFFRVLQPRRFGGYELGIGVFHQVATELSRGCPSSGWVYALTAGHPHTFASWPERAQVEVYGDDGNVVIPLSGLPAGRITPVEGGYRMSGAWDYSSGCDIATHFIGVALETAAGPPQARFCLVDREHFSIIDNWDVLGMRGTGSRRVVVDDVVVPEHRTLAAPGPEGAAFERPGTGLYDNPIYSGPFGSFLLSEVVAVAVGIGWAALDVYEEMLRAKKMSYPPFTQRSEDHLYQEWFGRAFALVDTAEAALAQTGRDYEEWCRRQSEDRVAFDDELNRRLLLREQSCVQLCWDAVDLLFRSAGTSGTRSGDRLLRCFRDLAEVRTHITLQHERSAENLGRVRFGMAPTTLY